MAFKKMNDTATTYVKFEKEGDSVTGYYMGMIKFEKDGEPKTKHVFKTDEKSESSFFGSALLDDRLSRIPVGTMTRVTYTGRVPSKSNPKFKFKNFDIETDSDADVLPQQGPKSVSAPAAVSSVADVASQLKARMVK